MGPDSNRGGRQSHYLAAAVTQYRYCMVLYSMDASLWRSSKFIFVSWEQRYEEVAHSFNMVDATKNGEISREDFLAAADDFYREWS